ncbi:MAG TPA: LON peptidase substrate-binding domain-containing protein [Pseudomonadota bacterium]|nr:LON peptidase substrate-binding domain-containing protein [Pseudomonadota bacterium]
MSKPTHEQDGLPQTFERLPIFPLHRVQLFPRAMLPLYVFEPRYREMTAACLAGDGLLAIAQLKPGFEKDYQGRPPVRAMAGLGKIIAHKQNPDGTYNILLEGLWRVRIDEELPPDRSYREVIAHRVRDRIAADLNEEQVRETLRSLVDKLARFIGEGGQTLLRLCAETRRLPCLIDVLSSALVRTPALRRRLFECRDLAVRADLLTVSLAKLVAGLNQGGDSSLN